eukprot:12089778-Ditylum_brightwellii.AAC.1
MGKPDHESTNEPKMLLYANVGTVTTALGGGTHEYVDLLIDDVLCQTVEDSIYMAPTKHTSMAPRTSVTIAEHEISEKTYKDSLSVYNNHTNMENLLIALI